MSLGRVKHRPVVALTTDFGHDDPFVGIMKGVILSICPAVDLVDLTHGIPPQDLLAGCLALEAARPFFPPGTIHVAVVDPGVGTRRGALLVRTERESYLAPDNGLLSFLEEQEIKEIRSLENPEYFLHPVSHTFHGRDVFAPASGHLAAGALPESFGPPRTNIVRIRLPVAIRTASGVEGEVLCFDRFGNAVTSVRARDMPANASGVRVGAHRIPLATTFASVPSGNALSVLGSSGRLEIAVRDGCAREALGLRRGDIVEVGS